MSVHKWTVEKYFVPLATCIPVKGYLRGTLLDLPREEFRLVPNELCELMANCKGMTVAEITEKYKNDFDVEQYMDFLAEHEFAIWCDADEIDLFAPLDTTFETPFTISTAIIYWDEDIQYSIPHLFDTIQKLNCQHISIICTAGKEERFWTDLFGLLANSSLITLEIYTLYTAGVNYPLLLEQQNRITKFLAFKAPETREEALKETPTRLFYDRKAIDRNFEESLVDSSLFTTNILFYLENVHYNSYYNKKIFIGSDGQLKTSGNQPVGYGHMDTLSAQEIKGIAQQPEVRAVWNAKKDNCDICKVCEFRYVCLDNRLPVQRNEQEWYYDKECNYNPFIGKWSGEALYEPVGACGVHSDENGFTLDQARLEPMLEEIWG